MHNPDADQSPFNSVPPAVFAIAGAMALIEAIFQLGGAGVLGGPEAIGWRLAAIQNYGFRDIVWDYAIETGVIPPDFFVRLVAFPFIHSSFTHAAFAVVIVLAIGKAVGEVYSGMAVILTFVLSSLFGATVYGTLLDTQYALFGGYPGGYGLIGAFTFLLWVNLAAVGANSLRAFTLIGVLMGIQLVFGLLLGSSPHWVAALAGFCAGFGLAFVLAPGGWARLLEKLRTR